MARGNRLLGVIVFWACALFMMMVWSRATPVPAFNEVLASYKGQTPIALGGRDGFSGEGSFHRRSYVLLPSFKFIKVQQTGSAPPTVRSNGTDYAMFLAFAVVIFLLDGWRRSRGDAKKNGPKAEER